MTIILALVFPISGIADEIEWERQSTISADVDCDGDEDTAIIGYVDEDVVVRLRLAGTADESSLRFGLGDPGRQDALCGNRVTLHMEESSVEQITEALGELPEGYRSGKGCFDLNLRGGECDSINIFWNHKTNELNWWRL